MNPRETLLLSVSGLFREEEIAKLGCKKSSLAKRGPLLGTILPVQIPLKTSSSLLKPAL